MSNMQYQNLSTKKIVENRFILILIIIFFLPRVSSFPFAAHQFILWAGNTVYKSQNFVHQVSVSLPVAYNNTYDRFLALAGVSTYMQNNIQFKMYRQPTMSDSTQTITVVAGSNTYFYSISVYIVLVQSGSDWVHMFNQTYICTVIDDPLQTNTFQNFVAIGPSVLVPATWFQPFPFLISYNAFSQMNIQVGVGILVMTLAAPNVVNMQLISFYYQAVLQVEFSVLLVNTVIMESYSFGRYTNYVAVLNGALLSDPANLNIPSVFMNAAFGGFDGNCVIGLTYLFMGGNSTNFGKRSLLFDAHSNPFSAVQNVIQLNSGGVDEYFYSFYDIVCLLICPNSSVYSTGTCFQVCSVGNCTTCKVGNTTSCDVCLATFGVATDGDSCQLCSVLLEGCLTCTNYTYCSSCVNNSYSTNGIGRCQLCSSLITNCLECSSINACDVCLNDSLAWNSQSGFCGFCWEVIPNCGRCSDSSYCLQCLNQSYIPSLGSCQVCQAIISNCVECVNTSFCVSCINNSYYLTAFLNTQYCFSCSLSLPNCKTCANSSFCDACLDNASYLGPDHNCHACSDSFPNCLACIYNTSSSQMSCTACQLTFLPNVTTGACLSCSSFISNCVNCTNSTFCLDCIDNTYTFRAGSSTCQLCSAVFPNCHQCNEQICIKCQSNLVSQDGGLSCECLMGHFASGLCTFISGCLLANLQSDGSQSCLLCDSGMFELLPLNGLCICKEGELINNICSTLDGCITPFIDSSGEQSCKFCDVSLHFKSTPNSLNQCVCQSHYEQNNGNCTQICGDGLMLTQYSNSCDDGNLQNGDGCSSLCVTQKGYKCLNGSRTTSSSCVYVGIPLNISLKEIRRNEGLNQGVFTFFISPPLITIKKMNLFQHVHLSCQSTYQVKSMNFADGVLQIITEFTTDMEGFPCDLEASFDSNIIISPNVTLSFKAVSNNIPLVISKYYSQYSTVKTIFEVISYISLGLFLISLPQKLIGAELIFSCQIVYLSNGFYDKPTFLLSSIKGLKLVTGYWSLFYNDQHRSMYLPFTDRVQLSSSFLESSLIILSCILVIFVLWLLLKLCQLVKRQEINSSRRSNFSNIKCIVFFLYNYLLFPMVAGFFCVTNIAAYFNNIRLNVQRYNYFTTEVSELSLLVGMFIFGVVISIQTFNLEEVSQRNGQTQPQRWYVIFFLVRSAIVAVLIEVGIKFSFEKIIFFLLCLMMVSFLLIIFFKAYHRIIDILGVLFCQFSSIFAIFLAMLHRFIDIAELIELLLIFVLEGILCLSILLCVVRVFLEYKRSVYLNCYKENKQKNQTVNSKQNINRQYDQQGAALQYMHDKIVDTVDEMNFRVINDNLTKNCRENPLTSLIQTENINSRLQKNKKKQCQQEQIIKKRLRESLLKKRKQLNVVQFNQ